MRHIHTHRQKDKHTQRQRERILFPLRKVDNQSYGIGKRCGWTQPGEISAPPGSKQGPLPLPHSFPGCSFSRLRAAICLHSAGSLQVGFFDLRSKPGPQSKLFQLSLVLSFQSLLPSVPPQTSPHTFSFQRRLLVSVVKKSRGHHDQNSLTKQGSVCMKQFLMRSWQRNESEILAWQEEEDGRNSGPSWQRSLWATDESNALSQGFSRGARPLASATNVVVGDVTAI